MYLGEEVMEYETLKKISERLVILPEVRYVFERIKKERNYLIPKDYLHWGTMSVCLAALTSGVKSSTKKYSYIEEGHVYATRVWLVKDAPVYCVSRKLLEALLEIDLTFEQMSELLEGFDPPLPTALFMLPVGLVRTPDNSTYLPYIITHWSNKNFPEYSTGVWHNIYTSPLGFPGTSHLHVSAMDNHQTLWSCERHFEEGKLVHRYGGITKTPNMTERDLKFTSKLFGLAISFFLSIAYYPEVMGAEKLVSTNNKKQQRKKHTKNEVENKVRIPRYLDRKYESSKIPSKGGTHKSPRMHWRVGHTRKLKSGKIVKVKPCLVNEGRS